MSPFAKLMLRFGWIRLSSYGLEVTLDGRLVSASMLPEAQLDLDWSNVPSPTLDFASTLEPVLATIPTRKPPPLPAAKARPPVAATMQAFVGAPVVAAPVAPAKATPTVASDDSLSEEDEWAWQAAVAKAKAESEAESPGRTEPKRSETEDEATGFADTTPLPGQALKLRPQPACPELENDTQVAAELDETGGEDWEVLVAAARSRERSDVEDTQHRSYDDTKIDQEPQRPDFAAAQVTQRDLPANDDLPADTVTSINAIKLRPLLARQDQESESSQDDEWTAMRGQIEAKDSEENARKMRAMREIQRLQGRSPLKDFRPRGVGAPPLRKRMAAGTSPAPTSRPTLTATTALPTRRPSPVSASMDASNHDTKIDLPRITERLSR